MKTKKLKITDTTNMACDKQKLNFINTKTSNKR